MDEQDGEIEQDIEREQYIRQFDAGRHLKSLRGNRPMVDVCKELGVSKGYLSEVERGRMPSDHFLDLIASKYGLDVDELYFRWGKVPILTQNEIANSKKLSSTIAQISRNRDLSDVQKERLYDSIHKAYQELIVQINSDKGGAKK